MSYNLFCRILRPQPITKVISATRPGWQNEHDKNNMIRRNWRISLAALFAITLAIGVSLVLHPTLFAKHNNPVLAKLLPTVEHSSLADGAAITRVFPAAGAKVQVVLAVTPESLLSDKQLQALSWDASAQIIQVALPVGDCVQQQSTFNNVLRGPSDLPRIVGGIGPGASLAWRWLAGQTDDNAKAISINFTPEQFWQPETPVLLDPAPLRSCDVPLPQTAEHGQWLVVLQKDLAGAAEAFVQAQPNAQSSIVSYDIDLADVMADALRQQLVVPTDVETGFGISLVELPSAQHTDTLTIFMSGDGGWRDLDKDIAGQMAEMGYPVLGIDVLRYYWDHKTPEQTAADLTRLMNCYQKKWGITHFNLAGYSFGADVLPAVYNRLAAEKQDQIDTIMLLAFARTGSFEIHLDGWLGTAGKEIETGPEMAKLPDGKVVCVYGEKEKLESGCTHATAVGEKLKLSGGHHFDRDYAALAKFLVSSIAKRQGGVNLTTTR